MALYHDRPDGWETWAETEVNDESSRYLNLDAGNHRVVFTAKRTAHLNVRGPAEGECNVIIIGGEIEIPAFEANTEISPSKINFGLEMQDISGVVWVEGVRVHGTDSGDALRFANCGDCYAINCHLEAWVRSETAAAGESPYTTPHHWDPIQNLGADSITISGCWLEGNYHCAYLPDTLHHKTTELVIDHTQFMGRVTAAEGGGTIQPARLVWWQSSSDDCDPVTFGDEVFADFPAGGAYGDSFAIAFQPNATLDGSGNATWGDVTGKIMPGGPPAGPLRATGAGMSYPEDQSGDGGGGDGGGEGGGVGYAAISDADTATDEDATTNGHDVTVAGNVGESDYALLVTAIEDDTIVSAPSGWTEVGKHATGTGVALYVYKKAGAVSGTTTYDASSYCRSSSICFRITDLHGDMEADFSTFSNDATPDGGPALTPAWGSDTTLWLSVLACNSTEQDNAVPTGYTLVTEYDQTAGYGPHLFVAERENETDSEDPGDWTMDSSATGVAATIGIRPAASEEGGSSSDIGKHPGRRPPVASVLIRPA